METTTEDFREALIAAVPRLRRYSYALAGSMADADDLLQMTVQRALVKHKQYTPGTTIDRWLMRICRNIWIDEMRSRKAKGETVELDDTIAPRVDGESALVARIGLKEVEAAMQTLNEGQREVLLLIGIEGYSYSEAASVLGVPVGTIMSRLARARSELVTRLNVAGSPA